MLLTFPMDEDTMGCIAWGKVMINRTAARSGESPVRSTVYSTGTERMSFTINIHAKKSNEPGSRNGWIYESAVVNMYSREEDSCSKKLASVVGMLRKSDPVIVFGKYTASVQRGPGGREYTAHSIDAFAVIPTAWLYDIFGALFQQIVAQAEPPKALKGRPAVPPKKASVPVKPKTEAPQISHPVVIEDDGGWFE